MLCARSLGSRFCVVPYENLKEGRLIRDVPVAGVKNLRELVECLKNPEPYLKREIQEEIPSIINTDIYSITSNYQPNNYFSFSTALIASCS